MGNEQKMNDDYHCNYHYIVHGVRKSVVWFRVQDPHLQYASEDYKSKQKELENNKRKRK